MKKHEFTTIFSSEIKPLVSEEKDKYLALASLVNISDFVPDIDTERNIDLLPIAFNACVVNRVNKNDDVVDSETAVAMANHFVNKPINIEHDRHRVLGTILSVGYSEFGTDKKLTEEQVKNYAGPFNITLGGVLWRVVSSELTDKIEESSDPTSDFYQKISASWELGFSEYEPVVLAMEEKNLENSIAFDDNSKDEVKSCLRASGGDGLHNNNKVYRKVVGNVVPLGVGLTENPAAEVKGIATESTNLEKVSEAIDSLEKKAEELKEDNNLKNSEVIEKSVSHCKENNVIENKDSTIMEIKSINDINEETLKELSASSVSDFIESELKQASEKFAAEKVELEDAVKAATEKNETLEKEHQTMKEEFDKVKATLEELEAEKLERAKIEKFNERMSLLDNDYVLEDKERKVIASDIKEMDDEQFSAYADKLAVLLSSKSKEAVAEKEEEAVASETETEEVVEEANASETTDSEPVSEEQVVEEAIDQAAKAEEEIPVTTAADEPTIQDKYKDAFSIDNFDIKL
jgi:myosin heavy subunit